MKNKQSQESCTLTIPISNRSVDSDLVEQVVKETFIKEHRKKQKEDEQLPSL